MYILIFSKIFRWCLFLKQKLNQNRWVPTSTGPGPSWMLALAEVKTKNGPKDLLWNQANAFLGAWSRLDHSFFWIKMADVS